MDNIRSLHKTEAIFTPLYLVAIYSRLLLFLRPFRRYIIFCNINISFFGKFKHLLVIFAFGYENTYFELLSHSVTVCLRRILAALAVCVSKLPFARLHKISSFAKSSAKFFYLSVVLILVLMIEI